MDDDGSSGRRGGDRFGVGWGLAGGTELRSVAEVRELAAWAERAGFDAFWVSQGRCVDPVVALTAAADDAPGLTEVGTSVVPLYGRHPLALAQATRTAQSAWGGRFTLGVGPSHREPVEGNLGLHWDRPLGYTTEFLAGLQPLLAGEPAREEGDQVTTRAELDVTAEPTPVLLAALGPRMLDLAGRRTAGTTVGQCGPRTIASFVRPTLHAAAEAAGRSDRPRIVALVRICVTDQPGPARALAEQIGAFYQALPSYAGVLAREGVDHAADLFLIGSWDDVVDGLGRYAEAGATDLRIEVSAPDPATRVATREALTDHLGGR